jgi:hypothetical protein
MTTDQVKVVVKKCVPNVKKKRVSAKEKRCVNWQRSVHEMKEYK